MAPGFSDARVGCISGAAFQQVCPYSCRAIHCRAVKLLAGLTICEEDCENIPPHWIAFKTNVTADSIRIANVQETASGVARLLSFLSCLSELCSFEDVPAPKILECL